MAIFHLLRPQVGMPLDPEEFPTNAGTRPSSGDSGFQLGAGTIWTQLAHTYPQATNPLAGLARCSAWSGAVGRSNFHQALLFRQMSKDVTLFLHTATELTDEQWEQLAALGVDVVDGEATGLEVDSQDQLAGVRLASGKVVPVQQLVVAPRFLARAGFLRELGVTMQEHAMGLGEQLQVDASGVTGVQGVWAAGNVSDVLAGVPAAAAAGTTAAAAIHMDLLKADAEAAARAAQDGEVFSGAMEAEVSRRVQGSRAHGLGSLPGGN
ncbi:FAD-dependent oxidoreductase [Streptomyces antimycoticus]|uniref:FAD-dependent oxidoreductase n=1 Tax=Streptomyces antimycoticus TaxID=68175 RepID=UPI0038184D47